ncbi:raffinose/stachyose/melibiose transport system permease protein [Candidatus Planktophila lacus]|uniref:Raffinose/stachyose/melibiose transport system permease protein n=2 Tax=Candidatus Planktophila lacus TaxID=1884913 RepID=A0AAD0E408_9ACTN|nr:raffinose/stachyose/melibiose transport system permease protein [Candidatus Planktophila lacus]
MKRFMKFAGVPLAIFSIVLVVPFVNGVYYTFTDWDGFETTKLVGFSNYAESFQDPTFWSTLRFTALFVVVSLVLVNAVAFGLALIVTSKLKSANFLRTFFFVPNLVGGVVLGVIWQFIFNSAIVALANKYDWELFKQSWLQDTNKAFWALIIVTVWQSSGYMMIVYITGLISIENDVLEASQIDGASPLRTLFTIKIPLMAQAFTIALFLTLRGGFMAYDVNVALTGGGPFRTTELISLHIFQDAFANGNFGTGQSKAVVMFLIVALAALVQVTVSKRYEVQR